MCSAAACILKIHKEWERAHCFLCYIPSSFSLPHQKKQTNLMHFMYIHTNTHTQREERQRAKWSGNQRGWKRSERKKTLSISHSLKWMHSIKRELLNWFFLLCSFLCLYILHYSQKLLEIATTFHRIEQLTTVAAQLIFLQHFSYSRFTQQLCFQVFNYTRGISLLESRKKKKKKILIKTHFILISLIILSSLR